VNESEGRRRGEDCLEEVKRDRILCTLPSTINITDTQERGGHGGGARAEKNRATGKMGDRAELLHQVLWCKGNYKVSRGRMGVRLRYDMPSNRRNRPRKSTRRGRFANPKNHGGGKNNHQSKERKERDPGKVDTEIHPREGKKTQNCKQKGAAEEGKTLRHHLGGGHKTEDHRQPRKPRKKRECPKAEPRSKVRKWTLHDTPAAGDLDREETTGLTPSGGWGVDHKNQDGKNPWSVGCPFKRMGGRGKKT